MSDGNTIIPSELDLFLKYYPDCASSLASIAFCGGADPTFYPLLWFDPKNSVTDQWDTTGQIPSGSGASGVIGQATTCDMANDEIRVTINNDPSRRPNLISDLNYTPFFIGYPSIFSSLTAVSGIAKIDLAWETIAENKVKGYYVTRSLSENGPYYRVSYLIPAKGNQDIGGIYAYSDTGLNNGTTYWYKLEVIDNNDLTIYFSTPLDANTFSMTPMATEISPNNTMAGGIALSITVTGTNFIPSSIVRWDGANLETSFISSTSSTATIPQELVAIAATHQVTVYNPPPGGGTSTAVLFTIKNPVPALREYSPIDPTEIIQSSSAFILTVYGTNFVCNSGDKSSQVRLAGSSTSITIEGCSSTELKARIPTSRISTAGSFTVTVYNPAPGGGTTSGETLKIIALTATITPTRTATRTRTPTTRYRTNTSAYRSPTPYRTRTTTLTRTITGTILITPSATSIPPSTFTPDPLMTGQVTPEPGTVTPTLLPGEPTYTPEPPPLPEEDNQEINVLSWRLLSILRVLGGSVAGIGLLSIPSFWLFRKRVKVKSSR
ncbi:MAG: hypothetical protein JW704_03910 [Anaerolineaceae bacterium]|nr:hypothetical protein [Anaerolineaceae bacterium]